MKIIITISETYNYKPMFGQQLQDFGLQTQLQFFEDYLGLVKKYLLKRSPILFMNDEVVSVEISE